MNLTYEQKLQRGKIDCERILDGLDELYAGNREFGARESKLIAQYRAKQNQSKGINHQPKDKR